MENENQKTKESKISDNKPRKLSSDSAKMSSGLQQNVSEPSETERHESSTYAGEHSSVKAPALGSDPVSSLVRDQDQKKEDQSESPFAVHSFVDVPSCELEGADGFYQQQFL